MAAGRLPTFARLQREGTHGPLATFLPALSPVVWTTIATGLPPRDHAILGFWHEAPAGEPALSPEEREQQERLAALGYIGAPAAPRPRPMILYRSTDRRGAPLWQLAGAAGQSSDVIAWWVTYPAEAIRGRMVSDRFLYNRFELASLARGLPYERDAPTVHPRELAVRLAPDIVPVAQVGAEALGRFVKGEIHIPAAPRLHEVEDELRIVHAKDQSVMSIADRFLADGRAELFAIYLQGIDVASHYFWKYRFPEEWEQRFPGEPVPPADRARYQGVIEAYYELVDGYLARLLAHRDPATTVLVCSDHGFVTGKRPPGTPGAAATVSGVHEDEGPPGILLVTGPGVPAGARIEDATVLDIAPTVLQRLAIARPASLQGRALFSGEQPGP